MEGMMWRLCVLVVLLSSLQLSSAQDLVNLVQPMVTDIAPTRTRMSAWMLFDGDKTTPVVVKRASNNYYGPNTARFWVTRPYSIRATHYRVILPADLDPVDAPTSWSVYIGNPDESDIVETKVTNAVFTNGVYEAALSKEADLTNFFFSLWDAETRITEIELLGPREALNALWPYGEYPCDQRLALITTTNGPDKVFSRSGNYVTPNQRRKLFKASSWDGGIIGATFEYDGYKPVLVGAELPEGPVVQEVVMNGSSLKFYGLRKVVLQGNFCRPKCDRFGGNGWVRLSVAKPKNFKNPAWSPDGLRIFVENPDAYKAYRLKLVPRQDHPSPFSYLQDILFLGCKTSTA